MRRVSLRQIAVLAFFLSLSLQQVLWARSFKGAATYTAHLAPSAVVVADFNGDGKLDLAVANKNSNDISVFMGNGDGTFQPQVKYLTGGTGPVAIAAADFNGDTKTDLVVVNFTSNNIGILMNTGTGTFNPAVKVNVGLGPTSVAAGDLNGDTIADLAVTNSTDGTVNVLLNNGSGTFTVNGTYHTDASPSSVAIADFNGNGSNDLAVTNLGANDFSILFNNGSGVFGAATNYCVVQAGGACTGTVGSPISVVAVDLNGDGKIDLAIASLSQAVSTFLNNGSGVFTSNAQALDSQTPHGIAAGDFNGDGKQDLVVADNTTNTFEIFKGSGAGGLNPAIRFLSGSQPVAIATGDFNKDGKLDVVVVNSAENDVTIALGNGDGTFQDIEDFGSGNNVRSIALGDFNADGKTDFATASGSAGSFAVGIFNGNGKGVFQQLAAIPFSVEIDSIAAGDFNQDKKLDFVVANKTANQVSVALGNANGTFAPIATYPTDAGPVSVAIGDFNKDGFPDLVTANTTAGTVSVLLNTKTGTFGSAVPYTVGTAPTAVVAADLNNDGFADLVVANGGNHTVSILMNNGSGVFTTSSPVSVGNNPVSVAAADLNGDHFLDLVVANKTDNTVSVALGNGDGTFQTPTTYSLPSSGPAAVLVSDVTVEGIPDIVVAGNTSNVVAVLQGNGDGTFLGAVNYKTGAGPVALASADVSGDGKADVLSGNLAGGDVTVLLNVSPAAAMSTAPTKLIFGNIQVGSSSTSQNIVLTNKGNSVLNIAGIVTSADYPMTTTCGATLGSLASCNITITFSPSYPGAINGQLSIQGNVPGNYLNIPLTGTGQFPMAVSPVTLNLGTVAVGQTSAAQTVTVTNQSTATQTFTISATGNYNAVGSGATPCNGSLAAGAKCGVSVTLSPTQSGAINGSFIVSGAGFLPQITSLSGNGTGGTALPLTFSPASLLFDSPALTFSSLPKTVTATNTTAAALNLTLTASTDWSVAGSGTKPCGGTLAAGAACQFQVIFTPSILGYFNGSISVATGSGNPIIYDLEGLGNLASSFSPGSMTFAPQAVGTTSPGQIVKVWNFQVTGMQVLGWYASGDYSAVPGGDQPCSTTTLVPPLLKPFCNLVITFTPTKTGAIPGAITVKTGWSTGAESFAVTGTGQ